MHDFVVAASGAFLGAVAAFLASLRLTMRTERQVLTEQLVTEFFSDSFFPHRVAVAGLARKLRDGLVDVDRLAEGYWYPGNSGTAYRGDVFDELNEHQHFEVLIGYVIRLEFAITKRNVDVERLAAILGQKPLWYADLLNEVSHATARQAVANGSQAPDWTRAATVVHKRTIRP